MAKPFNILNNLQKKELTFVEFCCEFGFADGFDFHLLPVLSKFGKVEYLLDISLNPTKIQVYPVTYNFWMQHQAQNINEAMVIELFKPK